MNFSDYLIIITIVVVIIFVALLYFNKKNYGKMIQAQDFIDQNKTVVQIFVIDKKKEKPTPTNLPKNVFSQLPKTSKLRKMNMVKAKVGPQIVTLMCDKPIYDILTPKRNVKVELAGIYIVSIVGMNLANKKNKSFSEKISLKMNQNLGQKRK